ncbi:MAG: FMN-dependent NADH-azoreductase [Rhodobiaceae bacterium]|nr:FMN-dependent NADH-azoreductase [Rhodobiaceae bacterium]
MTNPNTILRIEASARKTGSVSRDLTSKTIDHLASKTAVLVKERDVSEGLPFVDEEWVGSNFTPADARSETQKAKLAVSDGLVEELVEADTLVIGTPIYNFGIPATLKAWIDMVARVGVTFKYTENGPVGLLEGKRAIVLVASGGTPVGSDIDFATPYLRHALNFIGISDVTFVSADALGQDSNEKIATAKEEIDLLKVA